MKKTHLQNTTTRGQIIDTNLIFCNTHHTRRPSGVGFEIGGDGDYNILSFDQNYY